MLTLSRLLLNANVYKAGERYGYSSLSQSIIPVLKNVTNCNELSFSRYSKKRGKQLNQAAKRSKEVVRITSYNILWDMFEHKTKQEYLWQNRYKRVAETMLDGDADIIGLQEDRSHLLEDLKPFYNSRYKRVGVPGSSDECCSILFKKSRFECLSFSHTDLSSEKKRHLTGVKLRDLTTKKVVRVFNTHLHFSSLEKRQEQALVLKEHMQNTLLNAEDERVVLLGDFNTFPNRPDIFKNNPLDGDEVESLIEESGLVNTMTKAIFGCIGPRSSYNNCEQTQLLHGRCVPFEGIGVAGVYLDHIYTCRRVKVLVHAVNPALVDSLFASDHMPIICDVLL